MKRGLRRKILSGTILFVFSGVFLLSALRERDLPTQYLTQKEIIKRGADSEETVIPSGYGILDIGSSKGGSTGLLQSLIELACLNRALCKSVNTRILGLDIDPEKVKTCKSAGYNCMQGNALKLSPKSHTVEGVNMWHVLEHLPNCSLATEVWRKTSMVAKHFTSFRGPDFDKSEELRNMGFHRFYENWFAHTCAFNSSMMLQAMQSSYRAAHAYVITKRYPITASEHSALLPNGARRNSHRYILGEHPVKRKVHFNDTFYEEMRGCAIYDNLTVIDNLTASGMSVAGAVALRDALHLDSTTSSVMYCHFPGSGYKGKQTCAKFLKRIIRATIDLPV